MAETAKKGFARGRSWARRYAMQALYQWQVTGREAGAIDTRFLLDQDTDRADLDYFRELLQQVPNRAETINSMLKDFLDRPLEQLDPVEQAILWIAAYELQYRPEIPYRVVINEAVELAKKFGAEQGHRFINGVLDKVARQARIEEPGLSS